MRKKIKKLKIIIAVFLALFAGITPKRQVVYADAGASLIGGGLILNTINPVAWPVILIGLVACIVLGLAYQNRDELQAIGQAVGQELTKMGYALSDFVSGASVTIDDRLKQAIFNFADSMGETIPAYTEGQYIGAGQFEVRTGVVNSSAKLVQLASDGALWVGVQDKKQNISTGLGFGSKSFKDETDILVPSLTVTVNVEPIGNTNNLVLDIDRFDGRKVGIKEVVRDGVGNVIALTTTLSPAKPDTFDRYGIFIRNTGRNAAYNITSVTIPELGIGVASPEIPTTTIRGNEFDGRTRERVADAIVPAGTTEVLNFYPDAPIAYGGITALGLPGISDKVYDNSQVKTLEELQAEAGVNAGTATGVGTATGAGVNAGTNPLNLSGLWEWLKKILAALLNIPELIMKGLKALFDALMALLTKIWEAILGLGASVGTFILDGLKAMFGVDSAWFSGRVDALRLRFREKFPAIEPIGYGFSDKTTVSDITIDLPGYGTMTVVSGGIMTEYAGLVKMFLRGLFYMLLALFFFRKFHKTAEG